jgi:hypothetical protein
MTVNTQSLGSGVDIYYDKGSGVNLHGSALILVGWIRIRVWEVKKMTHKIEK